MLVVQLAPTTTVVMVETQHLVAFLQRAAEVKDIHPGLVGLALRLGLMVSSKASGAVWEVWVVAYGATEMTAVDLVTFKQVAGDAVFGAETHFMVVPAAAAVERLEHLPQFTQVTVVKAATAIIHRRRANNPVAAAAAPGMMWAVHRAVMGASASGRLWGNQ